MSTEPQLGKYVPLRMIVALFMDQYNKTTGDQDRYWQLGLRALVDLNFDISGEPETFRLPLNGNFTVNFPTGCISWTKIGLLNGNGEMSTLKINSGLSKWRDLNPNRLPLLTPDITDSIGTIATSPFWFNYYYNGNYCNLFGTETGLVQYGSCTVDEANELVVLDPNFQYDHIMFEGIFAPNRKDNNEYQVLLALQESIIAFIAWKLKLDTMENYYAEATKARRRLPGKKVTLQYANQIIRESEGMKLRS